MENDRLIPPAQAEELEMLYKLPLIYICATCNAYLSGFGDEVAYSLCSKCAAKKEWNSPSHLPPQAVKKDWRELAFWIVAGLVSATGLLAIIASVVVIGEWIYLLRH